MTQQDLEKLLKESEQIAQDWDSYVQFRQKRDAMMQKLMTEQGNNN